MVNAIPAPSEIAEQSQHATTVDGQFACQYCAEQFPDAEGVKPVNRHVATGACPDYIPGTGMGSYSSLAARDTETDTETTDTAVDTADTLQVEADRSEHATVADGALACTHCGKRFPAATNLNAVTGHLGWDRCPEYIPASSPATTDETNADAATTFTADPDTEAGSTTDWVPASSVAARDTTPTDAAATTATTDAADETTTTLAGRLYRFVPGRDDRPQFDAPENSSSLTRDGYRAANYALRTTFDRRVEFVVFFIGFTLGLVFVYDPGAVASRLVGLFATAYGLHGVGRVGASEKTELLDSLPASYQSLAESGRLLHDAHYLLAAFAIGGFLRYVDVRAGLGLLPGRGLFPEWLYRGYLEVHFHGGSVTFPTLVPDTFDVLRVLAGI